MLPQDIIDNTVRAFNVSATSATGYSDQGVPQGRYMAPANGPDCIEVAQTNTITGIGECGVRSLVVTGPRLVRFDLSTSKRIAISGQHQRGVPRRAAERVQHAMVRGGNGVCRHERHRHQHLHESEFVPGHRWGFRTHDSVRVPGQLLARGVSQTAAGEPIPLRLFLVREPTYNEGFCLAAFASMRGCCKELS